MPWTFLNNESNVKVIIDLRGAECELRMDQDSMGLGALT